jgi:hypothetical protein
MATAVMAARSSGENTLPIGLCGVLRRISRVWGETTRRSSSWSSTKSGARSVTGRRTAPAMAMQAAYES